MINQTPIDTTDDLEEIMDPEVLDEETIAKIKEKSISGVVSYFLRTAVLQGIGLVSAFLLSLFFSPTDFGIFGFVTQIIGLLIFFSDVGLAAALIQMKKEPNKKELRVAFTLQWVLSWLIVALVGVIIMTGVVQAKTGTAGVWLLIALALSFPLATLKTISSIKLERKLDFNKLIMPQIFEQIVFHGLLIYLAWNGMGVTAYAVAIIARSIVGVIAMWIIEPWWGIGFHLEKRILKSLLDFGLKFQLNDFLARIKDQLFFLGLAFFLPLEQFGYIQWSKNWSMYPYNLTVQNVMAITFPTFSRLQSRKDILKRAIEKSIYFISLSIFPILTGMALFIWPLSQVIDKYDKWEPAIPSFIFFTLSVGWAAISTPLINTLNAIGKIKQTLRLMVLWTSLTWILTPVLMWWLGFNGVALAAFLISFTSVLSIKLINKFIPVEVWPQTRLALGAATVMAVVGLMGMSIWAESLSKMLVGMVLTISSYVLTVLIFGRKRLFKEVGGLMKKK